MSKLKSTDIECPDIPSVGALQKVISDVWSDHSDVEVIEFFRSLYAHAVILQSRLTKESDS